MVRLITAEEGKEKGIELLSINTQV